MGALDGRVAFVAGASRGIGADIAKYLAAAGAKVIHVTPPTFDPVPIKTLPAAMIGDE